MKKLIAIVLATLMMFTFIAPATAATAAANEEATSSSTNIFDLIAEFFHNIIGSITKIFGGNCPYCDGIHNADKETDKEEVKNNGVNVSVLPENPVVNVDGFDYILDIAYNFTPAESIPTEYLGYKYWHADFVITSDKALSDVILAGQYDSYGEDYVGLLINEIKADKAVRIIKTFDDKFTDKEVTVNVEELFTTVESFNCGLRSLNINNAGANISVELRLYETEAPSEANGNSVNVETGNYITVATVNYTL